MSTWYVYILHCADHSLYTGIATDLYARVQKHNEGKGAKYTQGRGPVKLIYQECVDTRSLALRRERAIKKMRRIEKWRLVATWANEPPLEINRRADALATPPDAKSATDRWVLNPDNGHARNTG